MVRKAIVVTPTSLVSNWEAEINKWVGERVKLVALCESTRDDVVSGIESFINSLSNLQVNFSDLSNLQLWLRVSNSYNVLAGLNCFLRDISNAFFKI